MHSMLRRLLWLGLGLALATEVFGAPASQPSKTRGWERLSPAMTTAQVDAVLAPVLGAPLLINHSRGGRFEVWTYDRGGQVLFVNGALQYWTVAKFDPVRVSGVAQLRAQPARRVVPNPARPAQPAREVLKPSPAQVKAELAMNP